ncbi:MAG TPA: hypothetical protein VJA82_07330 [Sediminibacterium sp.]|uniref:hypothetical protein n=1 Tax=Sediminibacterium sp. TaxID=1917865 RepID=UPI0008D612AF|nr:hypothetical protein [Sediminibacterium sp.]OHC84524.1 MAG: hypothetical protein A2472_11210 [Sphingobacteriia bacterium RIFOXYC2_FULL_35_18]OHC89037.1 MAG: hypothetical protein A2546_09080 [Sphingobacteriia bacterium RIFOXYD2_FULL_35_12]HLD53097.1 hypothetical protein [Sediminibacterium sp.]
MNEQSKDEISLNDLFQKITDLITFILTQWWKIAIGVLLGGSIGFIYAWMQPITYTAKTTFVVEDAKSGGGLSSLASLAGQFGVDVGGGGGASLISGDNILYYFKSESLAKEVLLSPFDSKSNNTIADIYADKHGFREQWESNKKIGDIKFANQSNSQTNSRLKDSLLQSIIRDHILNGQFDINRIDKKAGFIQISVIMKDEELAKKYCDRLVTLAIQKYISIKTERQQKTVENLQARADSISYLLNRKTEASAVIQTAASTMDMNPLYKANSFVAAESTSRDKSMLAAVYAEVVKNLELAKFTLNQETPVIQITDQTNFPLLKTKKSRLKFAVVFGFISSILVIGLILTIRSFKPA